MFMPVIPAILTRNKRHSVDSEKVYHWLRARARAFKVGRLNFKVEGPKFLILTLKKHDVHNKVTRINNSLMRMEIWCHQFRIAFSGAFL